MALSDADLKKIGKVVEERIHSDSYLKEIGRMITVGVGEALEQVVFPELMKIEKKMATKDDIKSMATKDDLVNLEKRMDERMEGMEGRLTKRIDRVAEIVTDTRTNHERRIRKLEDVTGIEPEARLTF